MTETPINGPAPIDTLLDRERIKGAARMIPEGMDASKVTPEHIKDVADAVEIFVRAAKISRKDVARACGYSPGVISEFLAGNYNGNKAQVAIDLQAWLVEEEARRQRPKTTTFTWTNIAQQIKGVASYAKEFRKIALVYGPDSSGIGKTTSLQAIYQDMGPRQSCLVTIDKVDANPTGLLRKICAALRLDPSGTNRLRFTRIVEELQGRSHLLMIDQIHNLRGSKEDKPFYILTDIYDATQSGQLWCGTADLVAYLQRQASRTADESLAQIRRRIFPCVDLMQACRATGGGEPLADIDQIREMFGRNRLKLTPAGAKFLTAIANHPDSGSIGLCVQIVEYATMLAEQRNLASLDAPLLQQALRCGFSVSRADLLLQRMSQDSQPRMTKTA